MPNAILESLGLRAVLGWIAFDFCLGAQFGMAYRVQLNSEFVSKWEAAMFIWVLAAAGTAAMTVFVFVPATIGLRFLRGGTRPAWLNGLLVGLLALPVLFGVGGFFWWVGAHGETFREYLARTGPFHRRGVPFLTIFVLAGIVVGWERRGGARRAVRHLGSHAGVAKLADAQDLKS